MGICTHITLSDCTAFKSGIYYLCVCGVNIIQMSARINAHLSFNPFDDCGASQFKSHAYFGKCQSKVLYGKYYCDIYHLLLPPIWFTLAQSYSS